MKWKVAITGTHSTGKSTFLAELERRLRHEAITVTCVGSVASSARALGLPILGSHTYDSTLWIIAEGIRREIEAGLACDVVLVDRPVVDALGYLNAALSLRNEELEERQGRLLSNLVADHMRSYSVVVATVLDPAVTLGPGRDPNERYRAQAAAEIERLIHSLPIDVPRLRSDNQEDILRITLARLRTG